MNINQKHYQELLDKTTLNASAKNTLYAHWFTTVLGPMLALADEKKLFLLEFVERRHLAHEIENVLIKTQSAVQMKTTDPIKSIELELHEYFHGNLNTFKTDFLLFGTPFQQRVWKLLQTIPCGQTWSYQQLATAFGNPLAFRAVANANGKNQLAIIIPCHRVINKNGKLGGYGGGLHNKKWLLDHENTFSKR